MSPNENEDDLTEPEVESGVTHQKSDELEKQDAEAAGDADGEPQEDPVATDNM